MARVFKPIVYRIDNENLSIAKILLSGLAMFTVKGTGLSIDKRCRHWQAVFKLTLPPRLLCSLQGTQHWLFQYTSFVEHTQGEFSHVVQEHKGSCQPRDL